MPPAPEEPPLQPLAEPPAPVFSPLQALLPDAQPLRVKVDPAIRPAMLARIACKTGLQLHRRRLPLGDDLGNLTL